MLTCEYDYKSRGNEKADRVERLSTIINVLMRPKLPLLPKFWISLKSLKLLSRLKNLSLIVQDEHTLLKPVEILYLNVSTVTSGHGTV